MWIASGAKNLQGVDRLRQVLAGMPRAPAYLHIEGDIHRALRDYHASLKGVIEDNALAHTPGRGIKGAGPAQASLLLNGEHQQQRRVRQPLLNHAGHDLQNDRQTGSIVGPQIGCAIAI